MAYSQAAAAESVKPLFIRARDISGDKAVTTREICGAAESVSGCDTVLGAQQIGGLWRLYPKSRPARLELLMKGLVLRKTQVALHDNNPFLVQGRDGTSTASEATKVFISNVPISFSNVEIEKIIAKTGVSILSKMIDECDRDDTGKLTRWKTGRRFIYIAVPSSPLPQRLTMGPFSAKIYHREQRFSREKFCGNCLQKDHVKSECKNKVVCRQCKGEGHMAGDRLCGPYAHEQLSGPVSEERETIEMQEDDNNKDGGDHSGAEADTEAEQETVEHAEKKKEKRKMDQMLSPMPVGGKSTLDREPKMSREAVSGSDSDAISES